MIKLIRTDSDNKDFIELVHSLNSYLKIIDGEEHDFYNQYNNIDVLKHVVVAFLDNTPCGCGAFKAFNGESTEIKRMFTKPEFRGQGIASNILNELELWSRELNYKACILETGKRQNEAVAFYRKMNYQEISNFGPYANVENSICFKKILDEKG